MTNSWNINLSGQLFQTRLDKTVLKNFEPNLKFYDLWKKPIWTDWYQTLKFTRVNRMAYTPTQTLLTEWVTPVEKDLTMTTITIQAEQYWMFITLTDILLDTAPINLIKEWAGVLWDNASRIVDETIQQTLDTDVTNILYAGSATSRPTITNTDLMVTQLLAKWNALLSTKSAPTIWGSYVAVMHPNVIYDLQMEVWDKSWISVNKYTKSVSKIFNWEIWTIFNVRVIKSAFVQKFTSTVDVYPTYMMWEWAYWVAELQKMKSYISSKWSSDSDPLEQRRKLWCKRAMKTVVLQQDAIVRLESASSLNYSWN